MGWTEEWQYSKLVKCPLENQYFASYIAIERFILNAFVCSFGAKNLLNSPATLQFSTTVTTLVFTHKDKK